jgi:hypothetical protein
VSREHLRLPCGFRVPRSSSVRLIISSSQSVVPTSVNHRVEHSRIWKNFIADHYCPDNARARKLDKSSTSILATGPGKNDSLPSPLQTAIFPNSFRLTKRGFVLRAFRVLLLRRTSFKLIWASAAAPLTVEYQLRFFQTTISHRDTPLTR